MWGVNARINKYFYRLGIDKKPSFQIPCMVVIGSLSSAADNAMKNQPSRGCSLSLKKVEPAAEGRLSEQLETSLESGVA